jgi:hypothetical protein
MTIPPMYPAQYAPPPQGYPQGAPPPVMAQQPGWAPAPAPYPQVPQYQPPPQYQPGTQPAPIDMNARISGPQFPRELQGRTMQEAFQYYNIMREDFLRNQQARQAGQQPQQPGQPQGGQPQYQQPGQPQQQPGSAQPRVPQQQDTMQQFVQDAVRQVMPEMLAPIIIPQQQKTMQDTYIAATQRHQDWAQFDADIRQSLQGADANVLSNPAAWDAAYFHAKGKALSRAPQGYPQPPYGAASQQGSNGSAPPMPPGYPQQPTPQWGGMQVQPQAPQQQAFVESPTPQAPYQGGPSFADPRDEIFAKRFGIPVEVYRAGKVQPGTTQAPVPLLRMPQQAAFQGGPQAPQVAQWGPPPQTFQPYGYAPQAPVGPNGQPIPPGFYNPNFGNGNGNGY